MRKTLLLAIGAILSLCSCKKDDHNEEATNGAFPKTIVSEAIGAVGAIKTSENYTLDSNNRITSFTKKVVDNGTPTTNETYTISYNGNLPTSITVKNNTQNRVYTYTFAYNNGALQSITRNDNALKISYVYANDKISTKNVESGGIKRTFSYTHSPNKIEMVSQQSGETFNDRFTYTLNNDGNISSLEKITYIGNVPNVATQGSCTYRYDNKPNIFSREVFKYIAEIECATHYNFYGSHEKDPLLRVSSHNIVSYTKNLHDNTQADYNDLENATRTFSYEWNSNHTPKSMEYKKDNIRKATYTYTY